jgi:hypothetical protein
VEGPIKQLFECSSADFSVSLKFCECIYDRKLTKFGAKKSHLVVEIAATKYFSLVFEISTQNFDAIFSREIYFRIAKTLAWMIGYYHDIQ